MTERLALHTRFAAVRGRLERLEFAPGWRSWLFEFVLFGFKQGWACLFGALMLCLLIGTHLFWRPGLPIYRYDAITIGAVIIQVAMLRFRLETWSEARVIFAFHVIGTVMELFKTSAGSWLYPEPSILKIGAVPLFSGFMYASVGSYLARVWRIFAFRFTHFPSRRALGVLAAAIYVNFFTHHWLWDMRLLLFVAIASLFWRTRVYFRSLRTERWMPLLLGFLLVAVFIWLAENVGTLTAAWRYPDQSDHWTLVRPAKIGAWYLLMIISFVLVALLRDADDAAIRPSRPIPGRPSDVP